jgi:hypothetical protein
MSTPLWLGRYRHGALGPALAAVPRGESTVKKAPITGIKGQGGAFFAELRPLQAHQGHDVERRLSRFEGSRPTVWVAVLTERGRTLARRHQLGRTVRRRAL